MKPFLLVSLLFALTVAGGSIPPAPSYPTLVGASETRLAELPTPGTEPTAPIVTAPTLPPTPAPFPVKRAPVYVPAPASPPRTASGARETLTRLYVVVAWRMTPTLTVGEGATLVSTGRAGDCWTIPGGCIPAANVQVAP